VLVGVRAACVNYPDLLQTVGGYTTVGIYLSGV
jgi:NADPH:quinone reductase-like Zn-dependent oxidoreductase